MISNIFLSFIDEEQGKQYWQEHAKECLHLLEKVITGLLALLLVFISIHGIITENIYTDTKILDMSIFMIFYTILRALLIWINKHSIEYSPKVRLIILRVPCYLFGAFIPIVLCFCIQKTDSYLEMNSLFYMQAIMYFITSTIIGCWWINLYIAILPIIYSYIIIYQYYTTISSIAQSDYDALFFGSIFAFLTAVCSSYMTDEHLRKAFISREQVQKEKERIRNFFDMLPVCLVKIDVRTSTTQLNQNAKDLLTQFDCSFEEFSQSAYAQNNPSKNLWDGISSQMNSSQYSSKSNIHYDFIRIMDYSYKCKKGKKGKIIDFEIRFSQRKSIPDQILVTIQKKDKQRKLKEEMLANTYKNNLIRGISHDLRTPLNGIISLLNAYSPEERMKQNHIIINMSAQFLLFKLKDMLDYSQLETGLFVPKKESFYISSLFSSIINLCKPQADLEQVIIHQRIDPEISSLIYVDKDRVEQILVHLLQNAIKYTSKEGEICIEAKKKKEGLQFGVKDTGSGITIEKKKRLFSIISRNAIEYCEDKFLKDLREGLNEEENNIEEQKEEANVQQVFLSRHEDSTAYKFKENTVQGIGLQITQKLVKSMNSKLKVDSTEGEGTHFYFILRNYMLNKLKLSHAHTSYLDNNSLNDMNRQSSLMHVIHPKSNILMPEVLFENIQEKTNQDIALGEKMKLYTQSYSKTIMNTLRFTEEVNSFVTQRSRWALIVDDNGVNRMAISLLLRAENIQVVQKTDGKEAVEEMENQIKKYKKERDKRLLVDCIFMDLNMPNMDGMEATKLIKRALRKVDVDIPIFALTAYDTEQVKLDCLNNGFAEFLVKPIKLDELKRVLDK